MRAAAALLLLAACASQPKPAAPEFTEVPATAVDALCVRFHSEGISREQTLNVVATSQPLINDTSMHALADAAFFHGHVSAETAARLMRAGASALPVRAGAPECTWRSIPAAGAKIQSDVMTVELSAPFVNPFVRDSVGLLARLSLGGDAPTWYWVPLVRHGDGWAAGMPMTLSTRD